MKKLKLRLDAFSDAVIAIILTIMVLDLTPVMKDNWTNYLMLAKEIGVYFISFALVANMWYQHATTFNEIDDMSYRIMLYDFLYLAVLSLTPLATNMMAGNTTRITVIAYGVLSAVVSFTFRLLARAVLHFQYTDKSEMRQVYGKIYGEHNQFYAFLNIGLLVLAYFFPTVVVWFYLAYPVTNLLLSSRDRQQMYDVAQLTPAQRKEYLQLPREQMKAYRKMVDEQNAAAATAAANGQTAATKPAATDWTGVLSHWLDSRIGARSEAGAPGTADVDRIRQVRQEQWEQFVQQQKTIRSAQHTARQTQHDQRHIARDTQKQDADAAERALKLQQAAIDNAAKIAAQRRDAEAAEQRAAAKATEQKRQDDEAAQKAAAKAAAKAAEQKREAEEDARAAAAETEANRRAEARDAQLADAKLAAKQHKIDLKSQRREAKAAAHIAHDQAKAEKKAAKNQDKNAADQPAEQAAAEQTPNSAAADASSDDSNSGKQS
ncbi:TMEM175 family protein [Schleiferilactobacillus shenzhenensis]|uniref:DUF1211 domain-containing protein n=1 Tax=Schleiferilactobacillus shenzhenensis LY-73 TaxID=1231336 RepID=U4TT16_9LACO|nr:TMEM175 family protein [Schleiferilactobacillus shenzhenensis]ERL65028.1 hypothetical protein L248_2966 [Schleiferilactobacillus shenzhenensis LY-73]